MVTHDGPTEGSGRDGLYIVTDFARTNMVIDFDFESM